MQQPKQDRLVSLDAVRGVAVLGILMMNVQAFAMIPQAYELPTAHMDLSGANLTVWAIAHTFFSMKFITIFSALFGAGIVLMVGDGDARLHYRRMLWLLLIGLIHAYVFWYGDILVSYALMGMLVVMARHWRPRTLLLVGLIATAIVGLLMAGIYLALQYVPGGVDPVEMGFALSEEDRAELVATYQSGFIAHLAPNALTALFGQLAGIIVFGGRIIGVMMIGMALFKWGFFSARWSSVQYAVTAAISLVLGLGLAHWATDHLITTQWSLATAWPAVAANYVGSLLAALGYAAVIVLMARIKLFSMIIHVFAATGRMAFTNYLSQTLIMIFIFVGAPGLGLYGTVERVDQAKLVLLVWALQLVWSPLWLSVFRYGPLEWLWRSLTYGRLQPIRRGPPQPVPGA
ncbi:DUF418 domain-containing protein [Maricaulis sp. CAU 1757]